MEQNCSLSVLDSKISRENNKFVNSVYQKPTFSGVFTNFESFFSKCYKPSLIDSLGFCVRRPRQYDMICWGLDLISGFFVFFPG